LQQRGLSLGSVELSDVDPDAELREAFRVFDKKTRGDGYIPAADLRRIMTTMGDALDDEQVDEMFADAGVKPDSKVNFEQWKNMFG